MKKIALYVLEIYKHNAHLFCEVRGSVIMLLEFREKSIEILIANKIRSQEITLYYLETIPTIEKKNTQLSLVEHVHKTKK